MHSGECITGNMDTYPWLPPCTMSLFLIMHSPSYNTYDIIFIEKNYAVRPKFNKVNHTFNHTHLIKKSSYDPILFFFEFFNVLNNLFPIEITLDNGHWIRPGSWPPAAKLGPQWPLSSAILCDDKNQGYFFFCLVSFSPMTWSFRQAKIFT